MWESTWNDNRSCRASNGFAFRWIGRDGDLRTDLLHADWRERWCVGLGWERGWGWWERRCLSMCRHRCMGGELDHIDSRDELRTEQGSVTCLDPPDGRVCAWLRGCRHFDNKIRIRPSLNDGQGFWKDSSHVVAPWVNQLIADPITGAIIVYTPDFGKVHIRRYLCTFRDGHMGHERSTVRADCLCCLSLGKLFRGGCWRRRGWNFDIFDWTHHSGWCWMVWNRSLRSTANTETIIPPSVSGAKEFSDEVARIPLAGNYSR